MTERLIIAGAGGQGVMLLGKVLAGAAMKENRYVTWLPSYGAEVRGGTAYCMVVISDKEISSPRFEKADTLIIMNNPSLERFKKKISPAGLLILNSSLSEGDIKGSSVRRHPFTDIAFKLGNIRVANMVALGCYLRNKKTVGERSVIRAIEEIAPPEKRNLVEINKKALSMGMELK
jgi:2-oxoglutarate ferredoxin oxidoreductase subunit gamma